MNGHLQVMKYQHFTHTLVGDRSKGLADGCEVDHEKRLTNVIHLCI